MTITMFDSVEMGTVSPNSEALAGYTSGNWPTFGFMVAAFPKLAKAGRIISIAVNVEHDAVCIDCEPLDATPDQVPAWVERQFARGVKRPVVYTSVSGMQHVVDLLANNGIHRSEVRLWTAHYTFTPHLCGKQCGFGFRETADATQWTDKALGRNLDQSLCQDAFFGAKHGPNHHYDWYDSVPLNNKVYDERSIVQEYDKLRKGPLSRIIPNRPRLKALRDDLTLLSGRVAHVAMVDDPNKQTGRPSWGKFHRGWRYQRMLARSRGQRVA